MDPRTLFHVGVWPFSHRTNSVGAGLFRSWLFVSSHNIPRFGLHSADWGIWCSVTSSTISELDWHSRLLDMGPERWFHSLTREQAIDAASQLHRDVCLMTSNLDILDQYVLCLHGTASKILDISLGGCGGCGWGTPSPQFRWKRWDCGGLLWIRWADHQRYGLSYNVTF